MKVVRVLADHTVRLLGSCDDLRPPKQHGDIITVRQPLPGAGGLPTPPPDAMRAACYPCTAVMWPNGLREVAVEDRPDGPPPRWLPGWRPA